MPHFFIIDKDLCCIQALLQLTLLDLVKGDDEVATTLCDSFFIAALIEGDDGVGIGIDGANPRVTMS